MIHVVGPGMDSERTQRGDHDCRTMPDRSDTPADSEPPSTVAADPPRVLMCKAADKGSIPQTPHRP
jgi:hypothetical protein